MNVVRFGVQECELSDDGNWTSLKSVGGIDITPILNESTALELWPGPNAMPSAAAVIAQRIADRFGGEVLQIDENTSEPGLVY